MSKIPKGDIKNKKYRIPQSGIIGQDPVDMQSFPGTTYSHFQAKMENARCGQSAFLKKPTGPSRAILTVGRTVWAKFRPWLEKAGGNSCQTKLSGATVTSTDSRLGRPSGFRAEFGVANAFDGMRYLCEKVKAVHHYFTWVSYEATVSQLNDMKTILQAFESQQSVNSLVSNLTIWNFSGPSL